MTASNVLPAPYIHQYIFYIFIHSWAISIRFLNEISFQAQRARVPTIHADTRIRSCRRTGIGFQVHQLWHRICKQTRCWLSPPSPRIQWHGVCRPKQHLISFSHRTPGYFGWNSSPTQCCATRCVNVHQTTTSYISHLHLISAISTKIQIIRSHYSQ